MPDVGVLNLQIHDDSKQAAKGLDYLAGALYRVKKATEGLRLNSVASSIKRLADTVNQNLAGSTITKIRALATELEKLKGLGNLNIKISGGSSVQSMKDAVEAARASMSGINTGFEEFSQRASAASGDVDAFNRSVQETEQLMQSKAWSFGYDTFKQLFDEFSRMRSAMALPGGRNDLTTEVRHAFIGLRDGAIEVEGTVTDAVEDITQHLGEPIKYLEETTSQFGTINDFIGRTNDLVEEFAKNTSAFSSGENAIIPYAGGISEFEQSMERARISTNLEAEALRQMREEAERVRAEQEERFYAPPEPLSVEKTNEMADTLTQLDLLKAQLRDAEAAYNKFVNTLGEGATKTVQAGLKVQTLRDKIWEYNNALREAREAKEEYDEKEPIGLDQTNTMAGSLTQMDLLKAQLRDAEATYNKFVNTLGADAVKTIQAGLKVQTLRDKILDYENALRKAREEMERTSSTGYKMRTAFGNIKDGVQNLLKPITNLWKRFSQIVKYRAIRSVLKHITEGFSEGVQNVYQYSKLVGTDLAPAMDSAATAIQQFKNSIGAAVAPLIQAFIPTLKQIISVVIEGINYLNQFFALLNGQKTWTRALPETAEAFESTKKSAKGAGKAVKDLLASWDELNIIQSESGGGSGSGTGTSPEEYKNMFEEVDKFSSEVKDTLGFIDDYLGGLPGILKKAGAILLGWKFSKAFSGFLGEIGKLVAGGALVAIGLEISYGAGFDAGAKGQWDAQDILRGIVGGLATALGGSLITSAFGLGGGIGFGIGLTVAAVVTLVGWINGQRDLADAKKWGNLSMTRDQIERFVKSQFTFDIDPTIKVLDGVIQDEETARRNLNQKIIDFKTSLTTAKIMASIGVNSDETGEAVTNAVADARAAITAVEGLLKANNDGITVLMDTFKFTDAEGNDISKDILKSISIADKSVKDYFTDIGKQLAHWVTEGETKGWTEDITQSAIALMEREQKVLEKAKSYKDELEFNTKLGYSMNQIIDRDTAKQQIEVQKQLIEDYKSKALGALQSQFDTATELAGIAKAAADDVLERAENAKSNGDANMYNALMSQYNELISAATTYETEAQTALSKMQNIDDELAETKKKMAEQWATILEKVYGPDYEKDIEKVVSKYSFITPVQTGGFLTLEGGDTINSAINRLGYEETAKALKNRLIEELKDGDLSGATEHYFDELGGNLWGFLSDDLRRSVANNLVDAIGNNSEAYQIFKSMFGLDEETAKKYIDPMYQDVWNDILREPVTAPVEIEPEIINMDTLKKEIQDAMLDGVMGTDEALDLMIKYGTNMFDQAMEELQLHLDEEGIATGKLRPRGLIASAGGLPALPKSSYYTGTETVTADETSLANGVRQGNAGLQESSNEGVSLLTSINNYMRILAANSRLPRPNLTTIGMTNLAAQTAVSNVTGEG